MGARFLSPTPSIDNLGKVMLNRYARAFFTRVLTPIARVLLRIGVSPDAVTVVGTAGVVACAFVFYPRGQFVVGTLAITAFIFSDLVDGTMARLSGRSSAWGAFLDSTLDRIGDAAIFGALAIWFADRGHDRLMALLALYCLVAGALVSYARARAEGVGLSANVGIVERAERLVGVLVATGLAGFGVPYVQAIALWAIAVGSSVTFLQRVWTVRSQVLSAAAEGEAGPGGSPAPSAASPAPQSLVRRRLYAARSRRADDEKEGTPPASRADTRLLRGLRARGFRPGGRRDRRSRNRRSVRPS